MTGRALALILALAGCAAPPPPVPPPPLDEPLPPRAAPGRRPAALPPAAAPAIDRQLDQVEQDLERLRRELDARAARDTQ